MFTFFNYVESKRADDEGEVASWLILAAGLAAAAVVAAEALTGIIGELTSRVASSANVG